jgi:Mn-dependent DtxR family transcriptional regulator
MFSFCVSKTGHLFSGICTVVHMETLNNKVLLTLFELASAEERASIQALAVRLGVTRRDVAEAVSRLDRLGLVRAENVRLTFIGLTRALGLRASASRAARPRRSLAA